MLNLKGISLWILQIDVRTESKVGMVWEGGGLGDSPIALSSQPAGPDAISR